MGFQYVREHKIRILLIIFAWTQAQPVNFTIICISSILFLNIFIFVSSNTKINAHGFYPSWNSYFHILSINLWQTPHYGYMKVLSILSTSCEIFGADEVTVEVRMKWQWRRLSPQFLPFTSPNHYSTNALLSLTPVVCNNPYQAAYYHNLGIQVEGLISNLTHGWLQNSEVFILQTTHTKDHDRHNMSMCVMFTGYQGQAIIKNIIKVNLHHVPVLPLDNLSCLYPQQDEH
jgi:hypothetical protein